MLNFKAISIEDRQPFLELLKKTEFENSEFSFANIFIWQKAYDIKLSMEEHTIYISATIPATGEYVHFQPICTDKSDVLGIYNKIKNDIESHGGKFCITSANENCVEIAKEKLPEMIIEPAPDMYDYVYLTEDLSELEGKNYHKKRTHINKFNKTYEYEYKRIDEENKHHCMEIMDAWIEGFGGDPYDEKSVVELVLENFKELELFGAIIYVEGKPAAFTVGEALTDDMALIHLEKATFEHRGVYPIINQQFAKRELLGKFKYINREEDMGIEGIRQAKRSYYPYKMVKKYDIFEK